MSQATDLHNEIMAVIVEKLENKQAEYADVFGALDVTRAFFEVEYAGRLSATWKEVMAEDNQK